MALAAFSRRRAVRLAAVLIALAVLALAPAGASATGWTEQFVATSNAWATSHLDGVSCSPPRLCFAVGGATSGGTLRVVIGRRDGTSWSIQTIGSPGRRRELYGVSCPSATFCMAVGSFGPSICVAVEVPLAFT